MNDCQLFGEGVGTLERGTCIRIVLENRPHDIELKMFEDKSAT